MGMTISIKILPQLSVVTYEPLCHKDANWDWSPKHDAAIVTVKELIPNAPVLYYFDSTLPVTLQCDAQKVDQAMFYYKRANP